MLSKAWNIVSVPRPSEFSVRAHLEVMERRNVDIKMSHAGKRDGRGPIEGWALWPDNIFVAYSAVLDA
jgi:hypothetical protein